MKRALPRNTDVFWGSAVPVFEKGRLWDLKYILNPLL